MADMYANFAELKADTIEGTDWNIVLDDKDSDTLIIAPHGGGIEIGTTQVTEEVSNLTGYSYYTFNGLRSSNNGELHITSSNFDEPQAISMVGNSRRAVSLHGYSGDTPITYMGGLDIQLKNTIWKHLENAGFNVQQAPSEVEGTTDDNIVNRTVKGAGVQLELTTQQRKDFFTPDWGRSTRTDPANWTTDFHNYCQAIVDALEEVQSREFDDITTYKMDFNEDLDYGSGYKDEVEQGIDIGRQASDDLDANTNFDRAGNKIKYADGTDVDSLQPNEAGADVTGSNTANDTANVNGTSASTVQSNASEGKTAKDKLDSDVGSNTVESTTGSQDKADTAEQNAKNFASQESMKYDLGSSGEYFVDGESHDYTFPPIPAKYHSYMRVKILQHDMESGFNIYENGTLLVDGVNGTNDTKEWNEFDLINAELNETSENVITIEREAGSVDGGTLYKVELEIDHQAYAQDMRDEAKDDVANGNVTLPTTALNGAIDTATNNIRTDSYFYWDNSGFYAIDPNNTSNIVRITSGGIGVSQNGGNTYSTAMTGDGIVADVITAGFMQMDRLKGGSLALGGSGNGNGVFKVYDGDGELIAELDATNKGFEELQIGDVISDSVVKVNNHSLTFKVDPGSGDDDNIKVDDAGGGQTWSDPAKTVQGVIDALPRYNNGDIEIQVKSGYDNPVYENIEITGFLGAGRITIDFANNELQGHISVTECPQKVSVDRLTMNGAGTTYAGIYLSRATHFSITDSTLYGDNNKISYGIFIGDHSYAWIDVVEIYEFDHSAVRAAYGSLANVRDCKGLGGSYGVYAQYNATIGGTGTAPAGGTSNAHTYAGGENTGTWSSFDSGSATPPAPPETTETWTSVDAGAWRPNYGGQWSEDYPIQGKWDSWGLYKGLWFFPSDMWNTLDGKSITRVRAYIKRKSSGGYSSSQTAIIRHHGHTSQPSGEPTLSNTEYSTTEIKWGEGKWVTLPSSVHNNFSNASDSWGKGIGVYTSNTSNTDYMKFDEVAKIEVTYS